MTNDDYLLIAKALKGNRPALHWDVNDWSQAEQLQWLTDCNDIAKAIKANDASFEYESFLIACGFDEDQMKKILKINA